MENVINKKININLSELYTQDMFAEVSDKRDECTAFRQIRQDAWKIFDIMPLPNKKMEEWKQSSVNHIPFEEFKIGTLDPVACENLPFPPKELSENSILLFSCDGILQKSEGVEELRKQGVIISNWQDAMKNNGDITAEILQNPIVKWENGIFEAMNGAFLNMGLLIYVPKNVQIDKPIQNWMYFTEPRRAYFPKVTIIAESGSKLSYLENINAPLMYNPIFVNGVTELIVKENATVDFIRIQNLDDNAYYIDNGRAKIWENGNLNHFQANMGAGWSKTKIETKLTGQNANANLDGICFANQHQHVDQTTMQIHEAPYSYSNLKYNTVVTDKANAIYRGMIRAEEAAKKIDAYQHNKNLILSDDAKVSSIPGLEILTDDLSCSHGATVGQIDQNQLYYLTSRGINIDEAKQLIVTGFLGNIANQINDENVKMLINNIIEGKIIKEIYTKN